MTATACRFGCILVLITPTGGSQNLPFSRVEIETPPKGTDDVGRRKVRIFPSRASRLKQGDHRQEHDRDYGQNLPFSRVEIETPEVA